MTLPEYLNVLKEELESEVEILFSGMECIKALADPMKYAAFGGKRLRALLCLMVADALGVSRSKVMPLAVCLELIHAFSLVHDDLPCLDNDDFRREKPSCHIAYGEANALLAGDALMIFAFEVLADGIIANDIDPLKGLILTRAVAHHAGYSGMTGGQVFENEIQLPPSKEDLIELCKKKTGALFRISMAGSALICDANEEELKALSDYGENLGLAFQVIDDIMDFEKSDESLNFVGILGYEESKKFATELSNEACRSLQSIGERADMLIRLAKALLEREN